MAWFSLHSALKAFLCELLICLAGQSSSAGQATMCHKATGSSYESLHRHSCRTDEACCGIKHGPQFSSILLLPFASEYRVITAGGRQGKAGAGSLHAPGPAVPLADTPTAMLDGQVSIVITYIEVGTISGLR